MAGRTLAASCNLLGRLATADSDADAEQHGVLVPAALRLRAGWVVGSTPGSLPGSLSHLGCFLAHAWRLCARVARVPSAGRGRYEQVQAEAARGTALPGAQGELLIAAAAALATLYAELGSCYSGEVGCALAVLLGWRRGG